MAKSVKTQVDRLRIVFSDSNLTNVEIAERLSCSPAYISKLKLQDDVRPRAAFLKTVSHTFNISEKWLLEGTGAMKISVDDRLKQYLESLPSSGNSNDMYIKKLIENYLSMSEEEQTLLIKMLTHLFE